MRCEASIPSRSIRVRVPVVVRVSPVNPVRPDVDLLGITEEMERVDTIHLSLRPGVLPDTHTPHLSSVTKKSTPATTGLTGLTGGMWERAEPDGPVGTPEPYKPLPRTVSQ